MPSRSAKIRLLLAVDVVFCLVEFFVGHSVGSLALIADSFHMLNDVMSLVVSLYAIKLSKSKASSRYSYGWHRAEIVAALINGVFLLALCFSICIEAIERFFGDSELTDPKLVVIVGSLGLTSNFFGLLLFHGHTHSHEETLPKAIADQDNASSSTISYPIPANETTVAQERSHPRRDSFTDMYGYPAATRASVSQVAQDMMTASPRGRISIHHGNPPLSHNHEQALRGDGNYDRTLQRPQNVLIDITEGSSTETPSDDRPQDLMGGQHSHEHHKISTINAPGGSHGSMNMQSLILHVVGDALGNVGVIATGLVIWFSTWEYKYYFDPIISLVITVIIFSSALPLVRSASFILLQAVPSTISLEDIREDIKTIDGVLSVHELHVWQLSEDKIVASVHVLVSKNWEGMKGTQAIRDILHDHGVHSTTIQPECAPSVTVSNQENDCLTRCPPNEVCKPENACCPPPKVPSLV